MTTLHMNCVPYEQWENSTKNCLMGLKLPGFGKYHFQCTDSWKLSQTESAFFSYYVSNYSCHDDGLYLLVQTAYR